MKERNGGQAYLGSWFECTLHPGGEDMAEMLSVFQ